VGVGWIVWDSLFVVDNSMVIFVLVMIAGTCRKKFSVKLESSEGKCAKLYGELAIFDTA